MIREEREEKLSKQKEELEKRIKRLERKEKEKQKVRETDCVSREEWEECKDFAEEKKVNDKGEKGREVEGMLRKEEGYGKIDRLAEEIGKERKRKNTVISGLN